MKNQSKPCPDCGSTTLAQSMMQIGRIHVSDGGDAYSIEQTDNFEVQHIERSDCRV